MCLCYNELKVIGTKYNTQYCHPCVCMKVAVSLTCRAPCILGHFLRIQPGTSQYFPPLFLYVMCAGCSDVNVKGSAYSGVYSPYNLARHNITGLYCHSKNVWASKKVNRQNKPRYYIYRTTSKWARQEYLGQWSWVIDTQPCYHSNYTGGKHTNYM